MDIAKFLELEGLKLSKFFFYANSLDLRLQSAGVRTASFVNFITPDVYVTVITGLELHDDAPELYTPFATSPYRNLLYTDLLIGGSTALSDGSKLLTGTTIRHLPKYKFEDTVIAIVNPNISINFTINITTDVLNSFDGKFTATISGYYCSRRRA